MFDNSLVKTNKNLYVIIIFICLFFLTIPCNAKKVKYGPVQEIAGPGGREYQHQGFNTWVSGILPHERYIVYEPALVADGTVVDHEPSSIL